MACSNYTRPKGVMGGPCLECGASQPEHVKQIAENGGKFPLSETDALIIMMVASDALMSLDFVEMPAEAGAGACMLYDQMMARVAPLLPRGVEMDHVFSLINSARATANAFRVRHGIPVRE
jgi:hypothetical protein